VIAVAVTTAIVTAASYLAPESYAATAVGMLFLAATYLLVLRHDADFIRAHGLALGGLFEPEPLDPMRLVASALRAFAIALALLVVVAIPFARGFHAFYATVYHLRSSFDLGAVRSVVREIPGQLLVIALPEEAFFRGYVQTEIDALLGARRRFLGADVSLAIPIAALVFAVGHVLTRPDPGRLAVFFPGLVFGYLRARTKGIGTSVLFHAMCNLLSSALAAGYKLHP
jgi:membrane protease YdiL (CAAX protease family)